MRTSPTRAPRPCCPRPEDGTRRYERRRCGFESCRWHQDAPPRHLTVPGWIIAATSGEGARLIPAPKRVRVPPLQPAHPYVNSRLLGRSPGDGGASPSGWTVIEAEVVEARGREPRPSGCESRRSLHARARARAPRRRRPTGRSHWSQKPGSVGSTPTGGTLRTRPRGPTAESAGSNPARCGFDSRRGHDLRLMRRSPSGEGTGFQPRPSRVRSPGGVPHDLGVAQE